MKHSAKYAQLAPWEQEDAIELTCRTDNVFGIDDTCSNVGAHLEKEGMPQLSSEPLPVNDTATSIAQLRQLFGCSSLAVPMNYFLVGLVQGLSYPLLNVYPLALGASEAQQTTLLTLKGLPSCFKIVYGMISDNMPVGGLRRKPYLYMGWILSSLSLLPLVLLSDLSLLAGEEGTLDATTIVTNTTTESTSHWIAPENAPTMPLLSSFYGPMGCGWPMSWGMLWSPKGPNMNKITIEATPKPFVTY
jgi:BT1 family